MFDEIQLALRLQRNEKYTLCPRETHNSESLGGGAPSGVLGNIWAATYQNTGALGSQYLAQ